MISHFVLITIRIFSTCLFMRLPVLQFFLSIACILCETSAFLPFFRFFSLSEPFRDFTDAEHDCRQGFIRRVSQPITLSRKGRICGECTSSRRIKHGSRPLHLENQTTPAERRPEQAGNYDGKGTRYKYKEKRREFGKGVTLSHNALRNSFLILSEQNTCSFRFYMVVLILIYNFAFTTKALYYNTRHEKD